MAANRKELIKAIDDALGGDWEGAHTIVQRFETDQTASLIHALLHEIEGDMSNAEYWYRRAGAQNRFCKDLNTELRRIRDKLSRST